MNPISVETHEQIEVVDVTEAVLHELGKYREGLALVYLDHTTAGLLISADEPDLRDDLTRAVGDLLATFRPFRHCTEGKPNGEAHILSALAGTQVCLPIQNGSPILGKWQRLLLLELDGPQTRTVRMHVVPISGGNA